LEVAIELEDPFGDDSNDLPMQHYQYDFNCRLATESMIDSHRVRCPVLAPDIQALYSRWAADEEKWTKLVSERPGLVEVFDMNQGEWAVESNTRVATRCFPSPFITIYGHITLDSTP